MLSTCSTQNFKLYFFIIVKVFENTLKIVSKEHRYFSRNPSQMTGIFAFLQYIKIILLQPTDETFCWLATALPGPAVEWATAVRVRAIPLGLDGKLEDSSWARWAIDLGCIGGQSGHTRANSKLVLAPVPWAVGHLKTTCEPHNRKWTKIDVYQNLSLICSNLIDREK